MQTLHPRPRDARFPPPDHIENESQYSRIALQVLFELPGPGAVHQESVARAGLAHVAVVVGRVPGPDRGASAFEADETRHEDRGFGLAGEPERLLNGPCPGEPTPGHPCRRGPPGPPPPARAPPGPPP